MTHDVTKATDAPTNDTSWSRHALARKVGNLWHTSVNMPSGAETVIFAELSDARKWANGKGATSFDVTYSLS